MNTPAAAAVSATSGSFNEVRRRFRALLNAICTPSVEVTNGAARSSVVNAATDAANALQDGQ